MFYAFKGKIQDVNDNFIIIDVHDVIYEILIIYSKNFIKNKEQYVYVHQVINENEQYLIGFNDLKEKKVFLALNNVKGIGPKTAIEALKKTNPDDFINAINNKDLFFLEKLPRIGKKKAKQIILDLKEQLVVNNKEKQKNNRKIEIALKNLGLKNKEINDILNSLPQSVFDKEISIILKEALKIYKKMDNE